MFFIFPALSDLLGKEYQLSQKYEAAFFFPAFLGDINVKTIHSLQKHSRRKLLEIICTHLRVRRVHEQDQCRVCVSVCVCVWKRIEIETIKNGAI